MRKKKKTARKLTPKQMFFCKEYLVDLNATQAAIRAGYSKKTAGSIGTEYLHKPLIRAYIQGLMDKRAKKVEITAEKVLQEIAKLAFSNMADYVQFSENGTAAVDLSNITPEQAAAIQEVTVDEYVDRSQAEDGERVKKVKFKLADKGQNLERLGRHLKLFTDKVEHSFDVDFAEAIKNARARAGRE